MPLILKTSIHKTDEGIFIKDISGIYNASTNLTGWGDPNLEIANVVTANTVVTNLFDDTTANFILNYSTMTLSNSMVFGPFTNTFKDGILKAETTVNTQITVDELPVLQSLTNCVQKFFMCHADCCVDKYLLSSLDYNSINDHIIINNIMQAEAIRRTLKYAAHSMSMSKIKYFLELLNNFCQLCACPAE